MVVILMWLCEEASQVSLRRHFDWKSPPELIEITTLGNVTSSRNLDSSEWVTEILEQRPGLRQPWAAPPIGFC